MNWYLTVLKKYADFSGRARRKEYWMYFLFNMIFLIAAAVIDTLAGLQFSPLVPYGYVYMAYALGTFIPGLAVGVRRLHDVNKSGWWMFIVLVPIVGSIWLLVLWCTAGDAGENRFGPDPKGDNFVSTEALDSHLTN